MRTKAVALAMARSDARVNVPVADRIILHLWEQDHQADHYLVTTEVTRPGIAESCALHPPNVSRSMSDLMTNGWVSQHTRTVRGEDRRQKTWQLTEDGREAARERIAVLRDFLILIRSRDGELLEVRANEVASKLRPDLSLLQVLMHAQHEGVLNFGDIRFGTIVSQDADSPPPGSLSMLAGAHSTYHIPHRGPVRYMGEPTRSSCYVDGTTQTSRCWCSQESLGAERRPWSHIGCLHC